MYHSEASYTSSRRDQSTRRLMNVDGVVPQSAVSAVPAVPELSSNDYNADKVDLKRTLAAWCLGSTFYLALCIFMMVLNIGIVAFMVVSYTQDESFRRPWWLASAEAFITVVIVIEVLTHMYVAGRAFFQQCMHVADFIIMLVCVVLLVEHVTALWEEGMDEVRDVILGIRYAIQVCRTCSLLRITHKRYKMREARSLPAEGVVDFEAFDMEDQMDGALSRRSSMDFVMESEAKKAASRGEGGSIPRSNSEGQLGSPGDSFYATPHSSPYATKSTSPY